MSTGVAIDRGVGPGHHADVYIGDIPDELAFFLVALFLGANGYATFQRNKAWLTEETLWRDVTLKNPSNARSLMNYGNTLMARGDFIGALSYFNHALLLAPQYPVLLINLAIVEDAIGQPSLAEQHFQRALRQIWA